MLHLPSVLSPEDSEALSWVTCLQLSGEVAWQKTWWNPKLWKNIPHLCRIRQVLHPWNLLVYWVYWKSSQLPSLILIATAESLCPWSSQCMSFLWRQWRRLFVAGPPPTSSNLDRIFLHLDGVLEGAWRHMEVCWIKRIWWPKTSKRSDTYVWQDVSSRQKI